MVKKDETSEAVKDIQRVNISKAKAKRAEIRLKIEKIVRDVEHEPDDIAAHAIYELLNYGDVNKTNPYSVVSLNRKTIGELARLALDPSAKKYLSAFITFENESVKAENDGAGICLASIEIID